MKLLLIEDSHRLRHALGRGLRQMGYAVDMVGDGRDGYDYGRLNDYDVIILDLMLPEMDGLTVLRKLRALGKDTHILILSARDRIEDRVEGLELGADDYLVKPFSFGELCARIATLLRRRYDSKSPRLDLGPVTLDTAKRLATRDGNPIPLTPGEYSVLECLAMNRGRVVSKERLQKNIRDSDSYASTNVVEVLVCNLRKKIGADAGKQVVKTRRSHGYFIE